jgi:hypothetical protein
MKQDTERKMTQVNIFPLFSKYFHLHLKSADWQLQPHQQRVSIDLEICCLKWPHESEWAASGLRSTGWKRMMYNKIHIANRQDLHVMCSLCSWSSWLTQRSKKILRDDWNGPAVTFRARWDHTLGKSYYSKMKINIPLAGEEPWGFVFLEANAVI